MKYIVIFVLFFSCSISLTFSQNVEIKLLNRTGYDIENFSYSGNKLGTFKKNGQLSFKTDSLLLYYETPLDYLDGSIKGLKIDIINGAVSGNKVFIVKEGQYTFDIVLKKNPFDDKIYTLDFSKTKK